VHDRASSYDGPNRFSCRINIFFRGLLITKGKQVVTTWVLDNLAQDPVTRSSRSVVWDSSAPSVASAVKRMLAESRSRFGDDDGIDESWLVEYSWETAAGRVAEALVI
jgi:hypothetical protein